MPYGGIIYPLGDDYPLPQVLFCALGGGGADRYLLLDALEGHLGSQIPPREVLDTEMGLEEGEKDQKDPFFVEIGVDDDVFEHFRPFFAVFYDFPPTSSCFFRHRADIFLFF